MGVVIRYALYHFPLSCQPPTAGPVYAIFVTAQIARFMGPTWGPSGADRTQVGPMVAHELCYLGVHAEVQARPSAGTMLTTTLHVIFLRLFVHRCFHGPNWILNKERPLGEILIQRPLASPLYEVATHVKCHSGPISLWHHSIWPNKSRKNFTIRPLLNHWYCNYF